jgi:hypothetical protein
MDELQYFDLINPCKLFATLDDLVEFCEIGKHEPDYELALSAFFYAILLSPQLDFRDAALFHITSLLPCLPEHVFAIMN